MNSMSFLSNAFRPSEVSQAAPVMLQATRAAQEHQGIGVAKPWGDGADEALSVVDVVVEQMLPDKGAAICRTFNPNQELC